MVVLQSQSNGISHFTCNNTNEEKEEELMDTSDVVPPFHKQDEVNDITIVPTFDPSIAIVLFDESK